MIPSKANERLFKVALTFFSSLLNLTISYNKTVESEGSRLDSSSLMNKSSFPSKIIISAGIYFLIYLISS